MDWKAGLTEEQIKVIEQHIENVIKDRFKNFITKEESDKLKADLKAAELEKIKTSTTNEALSTQIQTLRSQVIDLEKEKSEQVEKYNVEIKKIEEFNKAKKMETLNTLLTENGITEKLMPTIQKLLTLEVENFDTLDLADEVNLKTIKDTLSNIKEQLGLSDEIDDTVINRQPTPIKKLQDVEVITGKKFK